MPIWKVIIKMVADLPEAVQKLSGFLIILPAIDLFRDMLLIQGSEIVFRDKDIVRLLLAIF